MQNHDSSLQAEILLLGTFHMANPGRDVINLEVDDVLAPHRQAELQDLAARLSRFEPTLVCVEHADQAETEAAYTSYCEGAAATRRDEVHQVAFRVARLCGVRRVYAIDDDTEMRWDGLEAYLDHHPDQAARFEEETRALQAQAKEDSKRLLGTTIAAFLRETNQDEAMRKDLSFYIDVLTLKGDGEDGIADLAVSWYERNIRIFSNIARVTEPTDRAFVVIGAGHAPILRHLTEVSSRHRLVDVDAYLQ